MMSSKAQVYAKKPFDFISKTEGPVYFEQVGMWTNGQDRTCQSIFVVKHETTDISNDEQVSLCLRYIHEGITFESFVAFLSTKETLFNLIRDTLNDMGLNPENIVGQCFDGASNICGKNKGVATRIQEIAPRATYVHCFGHRLNLALQDTG